MSSEQVDGLVVPTDLQERMEWLNKLHEQATERCEQTAAAADQFDVMDDSREARDARATSNLAMTQLQRIDRICGHFRPTYEDLLDSSQAACQVLAEELGEKGFKFEPKSEPDLLGYDPDVITSANTGMLGVQPDGEIREIKP